MLKKNNNQRTPLMERDLSENPFEVFKLWFELAQNSQIEMPEAMALSTISPAGIVSSRMVLLRGMDQDGFIFYTNYRSRKSQEMEANPHVSLLFYWQPLGRQVRIEGIAERVSGEVSDRYFKTRPRENQIAAWVSRQSQRLVSREELEKEFLAMKKKFAGRPVSRPDFWGGYRVLPQRFEFWQQGAYRLHDRIVYKRISKNQWQRFRLYP